MVSTLVRSNQSTPLKIVENSDRKFVKSVFVEDPGASEDRYIGYTDVELEMVEMRAILVGSASPSVTWTIRHGSDRSAAGTEVKTGGTTTTSTTTGSSVTVFNSGTIPAGSHIWLETTAQSGTVGQLCVVLVLGATPPADPGGGGDTSYPFAWTEIPVLDALDREVFVDSVAGADGNDGLSSGAPKQTFAAGLALLRDGHGDRLMLKKGGSYTGNMYPFTGSGASSARPMIVMAYGTGARPIIDSGNSQFYQNPFQTPTSYLWFIGLEVWSSTYTGGANRDGFHITWTGTDFLIEDCYIHNYSICVYINGATIGRYTNARVRECTIADAYLNSAGNPGTHGAYCVNDDSLTFESCRFIECGWPAADTTYASTFKHALYVHAGGTGTDGGGCTDVSVTDCICCGGDGFTIRPGGTVEGNVMSRSLSGIQVGMGDTAQVGGINVTMDDNAVVELESYSGGTTTIGIGIGNISGTSYVRRNIVTGTTMNPATDECRALWFRHPDDNTRVVGGPLTFDSNVFYKAGKILVPYDAASYTGTTNFIDNDFQTEDSNEADDETFSVSTVAVIDAMTGSGNNFYQHGTHEVAEDWYLRAGTGTDIDTLISEIGDATATKTARAYVDDTRTLATYATSIGLADYDALIDALRGQSRDTRDDRYTAQAINAYIKEGFS